MKVNILFYLERQKWMKEYIFENSMLSNYSMSFHFVLEIVMQKITCNMNNKWNLGELLSKNNQFYWQNWNHVFI
jgi:hypothetical protein